MSSPARSLTTARAHHFHSFKRLYDEVNKANPFGLSAGRLGLRRRLAAIDGDWTTTVNFELGLGWMVCFDSRPYSKLKLPGF